MRPIYIWQYPEWPKFTWKEEVIQSKLASVHYKHGQLTGMMKALRLDIQNASSLDMMTI